MAKIIPKGTEDYNKEIENLLKQIEGDYGTHKSANSVGMLLLSTIRGSSKNVTILPMAWYLGQGAKQCRAIEEPKDKLKSAPKGIGGKDRTDRRDKWYVGRPDDSKDDDDDGRYTTYGPDKVAEGGGSDALVYFTPSEWGGGESACSGPGTSWPADVVLFHELVHALRDMQGLSNQVPTVNTSYLNEEEFLAIVTANIYISAKGGTKFRANHFDDSVLWSPLDTSKGFVEYKDNGDNGEILNYYYSMWQPFFGQLANLTQPKFNPFREVMLRKGKRRPVHYRPA